MSENAAEAVALLAKAGDRDARREGAAAIAEYERALALGLPPDQRYQALLGLGGALRGVGRHQEAVHVFRAAIGEFPEMAALHIHLALAQHANGEGRQALVTLLDVALRHVPVGDQEPVLVAEREQLAREPLPDDGWRALTESLTRKEFARTFTFPFLFEVSGRMRAGLVTAARDADDDTKVNKRGKAAAGGAAAAVPAPPPASDEPFVIPLRKVASSVPSAITVGRGSANDVVIPDGFVSKVHAFLRHGERGWEMADAGARNGAWIGGKRLDPRGTPLALQSGDLLTFGRVVFFFLDAAALWDRLHPRLGTP